MFFKILRFFNIPDSLTLRQFSSQYGESLISGVCQYPDVPHNLIRSQETVLKTSDVPPPHTSPVLIDTFNFQGAVTNAYWPWLCDQGVGSRRLSNERVH